MAYAAQVAKLKAHENCLGTWEVALSDLYTNLTPASHPLGSAFGTVVDEESVAELTRIFVENKLAWSE